MRLKFSVIKTCSLIREAVLVLEGRNSSDGSLAFLGKKFASALMNIGHSALHLILKFWKK